MLSLTFTLVTDISYSVDDWASIQTECGVSYGDAVPASLVLDAALAASSNATSYNVTAYVSLGHVPVECFADGLSRTPTLTPASAANCAYGTLTVNVSSLLNDRCNFGCAHLPCAQSGDTCSSIAEANSLSYDQLVAINGLDLNCTKLPAAGGQICSSGSCTLYTVQTGDTCVGLYTANNITWTQLLAWNPCVLLS